jgi:hypothetical protein
VRGQYRSETRFIALDLSAACGMWACRPSSRGLSVSLSGHKREAGLQAGKEVEGTWAPTDMKREGGGFSCFRSSARAGYYYFIFASQHDPVAPLSRETGTPHSAGEQWRGAIYEWGGGMRGTRRASRHADILPHGSSGLSGITLADSIQACASGRPMPSTAHRASSIGSATSLLVMTPRPLSHRRRWLPASRPARPTQCVPHCASRAPTHRRRPLPSAT